MKIVNLIGNRTEGVNMFETIDYLKNGSERQQLAHKVILQLRIMHDLREYSPILCGTIPIGIDVDGSDLDIIVEVNDFVRFETLLKNLYGTQKNFKVSYFEVRNVPVITSNFLYKGFEVEIFGQSVPTNYQYAYLHMIIEQKLIETYPHIKKEVMTLKKLGVKTEPAFCKILGLDGDPYEELIKFGKERGFID